MSRADYVIKRMESALSKITPLTRQSYYRVSTATGGDSLIGRPGTTVNTDTLFTPQPYYKQLGKQRAILLSGAKQFNADDVYFTLSPNAITEAMLQVPQAVLVLKDASGAEEVYQVVHWNSDALNGKDVVFSVIGRSVKRG